MAIEASLQDSELGSLFTSVIEKARGRGFNRIINETYPKMTKLISTYRELGFEEILYIGFNRK